MIFISPKGEDILIRIKKFLVQENSSNEYQKRNLNLFRNFVEYAVSKNLKSILVKKDKFEKVKNISKRIQISEI